MKSTRKAVLFALALAAGLTIAVALVRAATPGQNFEWLSVSEGGILIGASGEGGEGEGEAFIPPPNMLVFAENFGAVAFLDGGAAGTLDAGGAPEALLLLETAEQTGTVGMGALLGGHAGLASGRFELEPEGEGEEEGLVFVPHASVTCTTYGDVIIQLGPAQEGESFLGDGGGESMLSAEAPLRLPIRVPRFFSQPPSSSEGDAQ